jgi:uncharacterized protein DUF4190
MSANPPQDAPQPDHPTAQQRPGYPSPPTPQAAYPLPAPGYPPTPGYPLSMPVYPPPATDYAPPPSTASYPYPPAAPAYPSMPLGAPYGAPGYASPSYIAPGYVPPPAGVSGNAVASVICAAIGLLLIVVGVILGILTEAVATTGAPIDVPGVTGVASLIALVCSVPAVITGHIAMGRIRQSGGALSGRRAAITGLILGYIEIATPIICLVLFIIVAIAFPPAR